MSSFLDEVASRTHKRVQFDKERVSIDQLRKWIKKKPATVDFAQAIHGKESVRLIAELKQASPSAGVIRSEADIPGRIRAYESGGASACSILTEEEYFHGSPQILEQVRTITRLPLLRKDFIVDGYQIEESRVLGADAVLLIAAILPAGLLRDFIQRAQDNQLAALVEVHDERELDYALESRAVIVGINNRDLRTLKIDLDTTERLLQRLPKYGYTVVAESGLRSPEDVARYAKAGVHAVLVGEALMRQTDVTQTVRGFVEAGKRSIA